MTTAVCISKHIIDALSFISQTTHDVQTTGHCRFNHKPACHTDSYVCCYPGVVFHDGRHSRKTLNQQVNQNIKVVQHTSELCSDPHYSFIKSRFSVFLSRHFWTLSFAVLMSFEIMMCWYL